MMTADVETISPGRNGARGGAHGSRARATTGSPWSDGDRLVGVVTRVDALEALSREE